MKVEITEKIKMEITKGELARITIIGIAEHFGKNELLSKNDFFKYSQMARDVMESHINKETHNQTNVTEGDSNGS